jgi:hypothetical protein
MRPSPPLPRHAHTLLLALALGCAEPAPPHAAVAATFAAFQEALLRGDRARLRALVASESRAAVDALPLERAAGKLPLRVLDVTGAEARFEVRALDPNEGGREARFTVVKEDGELRVDLVATVAHHHRERWLPGAAERLAVVPLTDAQRQRAADAAHRRTD